MVEFQDLLKRAVEEALKKNPVVDLRGIPMYEVFTAAARGEEWAVSRMMGEEIMKVWPGNLVKYDSFQQGIIPATGGSLELATNVDGGIALRFQTSRGPVCYLTTVDQLQEALDESKQAPTPPPLEEHEEEDQALD